MARSKSDISNGALRIFLQEVGKFYDTKRGFEPFGPKKKQKQVLLEYFKYQCCFCGSDITEKSLSQDHLIPMNKTALGLHAWVNIVPCCQTCNNEKQQKDWQEFLKFKSSNSEFKARTQRITSFVKKMGYDPNLDLHKYVDNLYQDVGEVTMTLINLRLKQAEDAINTLLKSG
ncbi:MAG: hypothetical protein GKR93_16515 [Gammaproteobacteria bacterium]|nr:hypothetical protein [Gammaproteobacteria bacterium]